MLKVIQGSTTKPQSSSQLISCLQQLPDPDGTLYIGYPIIGSPDGPLPIDALWLSPTKGAVIFDLVEGRNLTENYAEIQDDSYSIIEAKLMQYRLLRKGRKLAVPISAVTFAPVVPNAHEHSDDITVVCNSQNFTESMDLVEPWDADDGVYRRLLSVIQSISSIRKGRKKRVVHQENSRGAKLKVLEDSIANLDDQQHRAFIETVKGVQRIRGLAGSGKTIVLALKAAYLHAKHPDWRIAVTFNTRSLKGQFKSLITTFVQDQTTEEPDWNKLHIINAWGAPGGGDRTGIYYKYCFSNSLSYYDFRSAREHFGGDDVFRKVCDTAQKETLAPPEPLYEAILVDEAQDFPPSFLKLCYDILTEDKQLVYAYDELQTLGSQSLPSPEEIFGTHPNGESRVKFTSKQQDIILEKCYRNSRPVLASAHALGFGVYRNSDPQTGTGLVQIFDQNELWSEVGYFSEDDIEEGKLATLFRTDESSPDFLEEHSHIEDLVQFISFPDAETQNEWVANEIRKNIEEEELRYDDIIVVNTDPLSTRNVVPPIRETLFHCGINSHIAGVNTSADVFFDEDDSITFTGIYRAKGNEAGMVYIINAQDCFSSDANIATIRNRLFTAMTRSKAWVRVLGYGDAMDKLVAEHQLVKDNDFKLRFVYPTEEQRDKLKVVHRDMSTEQVIARRKKQSNLDEFLESLEKKDLFLEDFDPEQLKKLKAYVEKM